MVLRAAPSWVLDRGRACYWVLRRISLPRTRVNSDSWSDATDPTKWHHGYGGKGPRPGGFSSGGRKEDGAYAPLRDPSELDRPRHKERQAHHRAHGPRRRARREARVGVGAGLLDRRSLRHAHRLRGTRRGSPERLPPPDRLFGQRANHHAPSLRGGRDVGDTPEARLSRFDFQERR